MDFAAKRIRGVGVSGTTLNETTAMAKKRINDDSTIVLKEGISICAKMPLNSLIFGTYCGQELLLRRHCCCWILAAMVFRYLSV